VAVEPARPVVRPHRRGPSAFVVGEEVTVVSDALQLRRTPGDHQSEPADDLAAQLPSGAILTVAAGPARAHGQTWWPLAARTDGATVEGWAAATAPDGHRQLVPAATVDALVLTRLFPGDFRQVQGWGSNTEFYARFKYDGVPLRGHNGLDFGLPVGTPLLAVDDAEVIRADFDPTGFGHFLLLDHAWGESLCAHLDRIDVRVKQFVEEGEQVGLSGNTGISTGPHLHFSIRVHPYERKDGWGGFCDPTPFMAQPPLTLPFESMELAPSPLGDESRGSPRP
jgi:murein DD-endopeptidase MepM/ murein hydrolase activator NlpD